MENKGRGIMRTRLLHPWWTHLPAIAALVVLIIYIAANSPFPNNVPVHFNYGGEVDKYGSPWLVFGLVIGLSVFFILLSSFLDELWARQEKKKTFNGLSLLDDVVVGVMVGTSLGVGSAAFPWNYLGLVCGSAVVLAIILEIIRPYHIYRDNMVEQEAEALKPEIVRRLKENVPFVFWDSQNPFYITLLSTLLPVVLLASAVVSWFSEPWASLVLVIVALLLVMPYGGLRVIVTKQNITIRFGILGFKVLRLATEEIAAVETHQFSPLRDFGGYGIRFNREMAAYYLRGTRGVKITTVRGKKYLIGSDNTERLAVVISAVTQGSRAY
ncbi:MAG: DUF1648 domain-containing protein [Dehalococcoidales bacterium]|nr:DUF1648 domain-containing protein [Dehalococcoidales bacterium]